MISPLEDNSWSDTNARTMPLLIYCLGNSKKINKIFQNKKDMYVFLIEINWRKLAGFQLLFVFTNKLPVLFGSNA